MLYEFAVEVTNRLEQLDLINSMPKELLTEAILHSKWQTKSSQRKRKARRQSGCLKRPYKQRKNKAKSEKQGNEGKVYPIKRRVPKNS